MSAIIPKLQHAPSPY